MPVWVKGAYFLPVVWVKGFSAILASARCGKLEPMPRTIPDSGILDQHKDVSNKTSPPESGGAAMAHHVRIDILACVLAECPDEYLYASFSSFHLSPEL